MTTPPAHHTRFYIELAIAAHRAAHRRDPSGVEIGLMEMRGLEEGGAKRQPDVPLVVDGVPVSVGSLEDRVQCVR